MKIEIIKDYINQENYKNKVFADYLKDNIDDTISFISTCSKEEFVKVLYALKSVALYFNDDHIVEIAEERAKELSISRSRSFYNEIYLLLKDCNAEFRLIKPIVDEIDPLGLIEKNNKLYSYDSLIKKLCDGPISYHLDNKLNAIFKNSNEEKLLNLSEQIKISLKDGSVEKFLRYRPKCVTYYFEIDDDTIGALSINLENKDCEYFEDDGLCLGDFDYDVGDCLEIETNELFVKLLCNEFLNTAYDLNNCKHIKDYVRFQTIVTYKYGKCHELTVDARNKRYIYDVLEISYYDSFCNRNGFIFDAVFNGIKKLGFKELVLKEDDD